LTEISPTFAFPKDARAKISAAKEVKEVGRVTSSEKGKLPPEKNGERLISLLGSFHGKK